MAPLNEALDADATSADAPAAASIEQGSDAAHDLSPFAGRYLRYVLDHPECARPLAAESLHSLPDWVRRYPYRIQPLPALVGAAKRRRIERATVGLTRLVRSIPERLFDGNARRLCEFYGWLDAGLLGLILEPPNGIDTCFARCDFIDDGAAFKCVELNMSACIGGWQHRFFEGALREMPPLAGLLAAEGLTASYRDSWRAALTLVVEQGERLGHADGGEFNIAVVVEEDNIWGESVEAFDRVFREVLSARGGAATGRALRCSYPAGLEARGGRLYCQGHVVEAVIEFTPAQTPSEVYRRFKAGRISLYNGPVSGLLGDKRNLALLSEHQDSDLFSTEERQLIADHVPWSRSLTDEYVTWQGERTRLLDFACANRRSLVLKSASGFSGIDVHLGSVTEPERWRRLLEAAAGTRTMLLQEYLTSRPYLFQLGGQGIAPHQVVWGTFCFGATFGGGFLRMLPWERGPGIINSAQGATEGLILEI